MCGNPPRNLLCFSHLPPLSTPILLPSTIAPILPPQILEISHLQAGLLIYLLCGDSSRICEILLQFLSPPDLLELRHVASVIGTGDELEVIYSGILQYFVVQLLFFVSSVLKSLSLGQNNKLCSSIRGFSVMGRQWICALLEPACHVARLIFSILEEILI
jgi:hypothetical protein